MRALATGRQEHTCAAAGLLRRPAENAMNQFVRLGPISRPVLRLWVDGAPIEAGARDSVLVAMLLAGRVVRRSEFSAESRAGFCLMGACQDCWVWTEDGARLRACTTPAQDGMRLLTMAPQGWPLG